MKTRRVLSGLVALTLFAVQLSRAASPHLISITGANAAVALASTDIKASSFQVVAAAANTGTARIADSTASSTVGEPLVGGSSQYFAPQASKSYDLQNFSIWVATSDKITVIYTDLL